MTSIGPAVTELLTIGQVAQRLGVSVDTIRSWSRQGKLRPVRTEGNHRRYRLRDVEQMQGSLGKDSRDGQGSPGMANSQAPRAAPIRERGVAKREKPEPSYWQERMRDARARTEVIKAHEEARSLAGVRAAQIARAARKAEEARIRQEQDRKREERERRREQHDRKLEALKEYGRSLGILAGLPAEWRARVTAEVERYVTPDRFPMTLTDHEGHEYIRARVDAVSARYRAKQTEELEKVRRQREMEGERSKVRELIEWGKTRASWGTLLWDNRDAERAHRDVARELAEQVRPGWTRADVQNVVDEVLADWVEDDGEDGEMHAEPDADDDGL
jgi:excisionase family DNA binding protein